MDTKQLYDLMDDKPKPKTYATMQMKGTDICADFQCECGHHNHYDGYFAHALKCSGCGAIYGVNPTIELTKINNFEGSFLESEDI